MIIPGLEKLELPTAAAAFAAAQDADLAKLCELDQLYGAMKPSRELREATARTGRQRLSLNLELTAEPFWRDIEQARLAKRLEAYEPIVLGTQGALGQMPLDDTLGLAFYHGLTPFVNAALKLVRMGQLACQKSSPRPWAKPAEWSNGPSGFPLKKWAGCVPRSTSAARGTRPLSADFLSHEQQQTI